MKIEVPIKAISINACFQGRRFKTEAYKAWRKEFYYLTLKQKPVENPTYLRAEFYVSNFRMSDLDNLLKPLLDALQECEIIKNDNTIREIRALKIKCKKEEEKIIIDLC